MKKKLLLTLLALTSCAFVFAGSVNIEAKHQRIEVDKNKGYFEGDVKVKVGDVVVKSPRAELDLDPSSKKPSLATFLDNPYAFQDKGNKKHEIKAQIIKVSLIRKNITAIGNSQTIMLENRQPIIVVNAESQEYDTNTKIMKANGGVIINYKDLETFSNYAEAMIDKNGDINDLKLRGNVVMKEKNNVIKGDNFDYTPSRDEYRVSGNTHSNVVFEDGSRVLVWAKYQQLNRSGSSMVAGGNVKIHYKDYIAVGPKAHLLIDEKTNKPSAIVFTGRSKITEKTNTVEADRIKMTLNPKSFYADGNVKTTISGDKSENLELMP